ncbi:hypothetical protein IscW_ISCW002123 [Ixodes scapularis]|uniref:Uncharacterized protein n=1 Tax=Ixodes scapularis TaxID=6945 RepID=B7P7U4_IXOSC|nr:hypothetical protein IscW_ISCW002123 [Ixodes scapularis]|eukprot:XP_002399715.1 hypothetical protein IscW_ISCW002123 [Ixodes scapularis]
MAHGTPRMFPGRKLKIRKKNKGGRKSIYYEPAAVAGRSGRPSGGPLSGSCSGPRRRRRAGRW